MKMNYLQCIYIIHIKEKNIPINISNNKIYIYASNNISKDFIISRYKRYNVDISITEYKDNYLIELHNNNTKNNFIMNKIYFIKDTLYNIAELIGNILVS